MLSSLDTLLPVLLIVGDDDEVRVTDRDRDGEEVMDGMDETVSETLDVDVGDFDKETSEVDDGDRENVIESLDVDECSSVLEIDGDLDGVGLAETSADPEEDGEPDKETDTDNELVGLLSALWVPLVEESGVREELIVPDAEGECDTENDTSLDSVLGLAETDGEWDVVGDDVTSADAVTLDDREPTESDASLVVLPLNVLECVTLPL